MVLVVVVVVEVVVVVVVLVYIPQVLFLGIVENIQVACEQTGSSSSRKGVNSSSMVKMLVVCEPVLSSP